jgi:monofunctional biosynthetic peptidoglycan transglycosylase
MATSRIRRWAGVLLWVVGIVLLTPMVVLVLYRFVPPPGTPLMLLRLAEGEPLDYRWVPLGAIAPTLPQMVVAAEDNLFCRHWGFDVDALQEQIETALEGEHARGASTISMQLAKNLFLWPSRSVVRKGLELWLTPYVELMLPKRRIIELYLNVAEWSRGVYGAEAAARAHFGVAAARLTAQQASLLAAVLPNPRRWSAAEPTAYIRGRAALYRQRVGQLGPAYLGCLR